MQSNSLVLSTDDLPPADRAPVWREWVFKLFGGLESDLYGDTRFDGHVYTAHAGEVVLTRLESGRHRVMRSATLARHSEVGYLKIVAPYRGRAGVHQKGRQAWVSAGEWSIYDTTEHYQVDNPEQVEHLIVQVPKASLVEHGLPIDELMARRLGSGGGISRVALQTMRSAYAELPGITPDAAHGVGQAIVQMVRLSLLDLAGRHTAVTQREALRERIKQLVASRLADPELRVQGIADALGCSLRNLYNAFADEADGVAGYLLAQRLDAARRDLADPARAGDSITLIAMMRGFKSMAHFSRAFRARYGMTPSDCRAAALATMRA